MSFEYKYIKGRNRKEITIAVTCLDCKCIVPTNYPHTQYCKPCYRLKRCRKAKVYNDAIKKEYQPKHCEDCNRKLPKRTWNKPQVKRCDWCQFIFSKKRAKKYDKDRKSWNHNIRIDDFIVAITCIRCGVIVGTNHQGRRKCEPCLRNNKLKEEGKFITSINEKRRKGKEYMKKTHTGCNITENIGTFDTVDNFGRVRNEMKKKPDGTPDWEQEALEVRILKNKTFSRKKNKLKYTVTEADVKRNIAKEYKEDEK